MVGISKGSSRALCFVIDTSKSMSDDIAVVKTVTSSIINSHVGTESEPSVYILVPFNDPEVALVKSSKGSEEIMGVVVPQDSGNYLVQVDVMPSVEFVVRANSGTIMIPGTLFSVPFTVASGGPDQNVTIRATNSKGFDTTSPTLLFLQSGNSTIGTVTLSAPLSTPSGSDVVLTIEAEALDGTDSNYIVLRLSIVNPVITPQINHMNFYQRLT
ncbi:hypothetical protein GOODEAATRI_012722, partial [Goodea atripinnis]